MGSVWTKGVVSSQRMGYFFSENSVATFHSSMEVSPSGVLPAQEVNSGQAAGVIEREPREWGMTVLCKTRSQDLPHRIFLSVVVENPDSD